jgi:TIR domain/Ferritin-like
MTIQVFLSHRWAEGEHLFTMELAKKLQDYADISPILDEAALKAGDKIREWMEYSAKKADVVVFVVSPASLASENCKFELSKARVFGKPIVPLLLRKTPLPDFLADLKCLEVGDHRDMPFSKVEELVEAIRHHARRAVPLESHAALLSHLRYAAGVELAAMLKYISATWSIRRTLDDLPQPLRDDVRVAFVELRLIAVGEMRHIRTINNLLEALSPPGTYEPALAVAAEIPSARTGGYQPLKFQPAEPAALDDLIAMEAQCQSREADGLYGRIYATLIALNSSEESIQWIQTVMSSHGDHHHTICRAKESLSRLTPPATYLIAPNLAVPSATDTEHRRLQERFAYLLHNLYVGFATGLAAGASIMNTARASMLGSSGIEGALNGLAAKGFLVVFDPLSDPRFAPIPHP